MLDTSVRIGTGIQRQFIERIQMTGLAASASIRDPNHAIRYLQPRFVALNSRTIHYFLSIIELMIRSRHRRKTWDFVQRSLRFGEDFTNIGGIDLQFSHLIPFDPSFRIAPEQDACREGTERLT